MSRWPGFGGFTVVQKRALSTLGRALAEADSEARVALGFGATGADITLIPASLVRPTVVVRFDVPFVDDDVVTERALSPLAWEGNLDREIWRELSSPLVNVPHLGRAHDRRPWVVTHGLEALPSAMCVARDMDAQVHVIGLGPLDWSSHRDVVAWPCIPSVVFGLLGRAVHVVGGGPGDPLLLDAWRLGLPTTGDSDLLPWLGGSVPPGLLGHVPLWNEVARTFAQVRDGHPAPALFTPHWIEEGRRLARAGSAVDKAGSPLRLALRRYAKLRREPERFLADSRYRALRGLGRWWFPD
jgi:hypothetical protein